MSGTKREDILRNLRMVVKVIGALAPSDPRLAALTGHLEDGLDVLVLGSRAYALFAENMAAAEKLVNEALHDGSVPEDLIEDASGEIDRLNAILQARRTALFTRG